MTIASFPRQLLVITSKQRPRKLTIHGNDGEDYAFLLKGHEDLRKDERFMQVIFKKKKKKKLFSYCVNYKITLCSIVFQLFGLVNTLLENSRKTAEKDLSIQRYSVIPLVDSLDGFPTAIPFTILFENTEMHERFVFLFMKVFTLESFC